MFNKKLSTDAFTNLISEGTCINGTVNFTGIIKIQGTVDGDVMCGDEPTTGDTPSQIIVDTAGVVNSHSMQSHHMVIAGNVTSKNIACSGIMRILHTAVISGATIQYSTLEIEPGAILDKCQMEHMSNTSNS